MKKFFRVAPDGFRVEAGLPPAPLCGLEMSICVGVFQWVTLVLLY